MNKLTSKIDVALVEDDAATRERFCASIAASEYLRLVYAAVCGNDMLNWLKDHHADVLLSDLGLPDISGIDVIRYCAIRHPATDIMVISMFEDESHVLASIEAGASGYLLKDAMDDDIEKQIMLLSSGGAPMTPVIARLVLRKFRKEPAPAVDVPPGGALTPRELEVLNYISRGFKYAEVARLHEVSIHTVHTHIKNIYVKLAVHSKSEAVYEANKLGLLK
ncbi:response regulator [Undibacterium sp. TC4M20W]|jgi:DNA-binding NarL/FixJ family response regulator|uniref:response regulator n=1 Tax=Undibacterium sp. TC4M20W TaxID=3413052 RepID=UPI003BF43E3E